jgi:nitrite reductase (NADH) large subunit
MNMIRTPRRRLVLVGNGMAGIRAVEEVMARAPGEFAITVFGAEPHGNYNRIMLSPVLAGEKTFAEIVTHDRGWYADNGIELIAGEAVVAIDRAARAVTGERGTMRPYDVLLLATGSNPFMLPLPGADLAGVIGFRDVADVSAMQQACARGGSAVVIGGGLLGLEAANGLRRGGMDVTVLHLLPTLMERQLDPVSAGMLKHDLETRGLTVLTEANTQSILGEDRVRGVLLADGRELRADLVVMAVGIRPNVALAAEAGLKVNRGVVVDDVMQTSADGIFALGECAEHRGICYGLVEPAYEQARVLARHLAGREVAYRGSVVATNLKVSGVAVFSAGDFLGSEGSESIVLSDVRRGAYKKLVIADGRLTGAVLIGEVADALWYLELIRSREPVARIRKDMMFGRALARKAA